MGVGGWEVAGQREEDEANDKDYKTSVHKHLSKSTGMWLLRSKLFVQKERGSVK